MEWGRSEDEIIIGYKNESFQLYNTFQKKYTKTISKLEGEGSIIGVAPLNKSIIAAKDDGVISIWNRKTVDYFSINLEEKSSLDAIFYDKSRENVIGTGGEFNDFKLWDLETKQCIFKAKSVRQIVCLNCFKTLTIWRAQIYYSESVKKYYYPIMFGSFVFFRFVL